MHKAFDGPFDACALPYLLDYLGALGIVRSVCVEEAGVTAQLVHLMDDLLSERHGDRPIQMDPKDVNAVACELERGRRAEAAGRAEDEGPALSRCRCCHGPDPPRGLPVPPGREILRRALA